MHSTTTSMIANRISKNASTITSRISNFSTIAPTSSSSSRVASRIQTAAGTRLLSSRLQTHEIHIARAGVQRRSLSSANAVAEDEPPRRRRTLETKDPIMLVSFWVIAVVVLRPWFEIQNRPSNSWSRNLLFTLSSIYCIVCSPWCFVLLMKFDSILYSETLNPILDGTSSGTDKDDFTGGQCRRSPRDSVGSQTKRMQWSLVYPELCLWKAKKRFGNEIARCQSVRRAHGTLQRRRNRHGLGRDRTL